MKRLSLLLVAGAFLAAAVGATATRGLAPAATNVEIAYALVGADGKILLGKTRDLKVKSHPRAGVYCLSTFAERDAIVPVSAAVDVRPTKGGWTRSSPRTAVWRVKPTSACTGRALAQTEVGLVEVDTYACPPGGSCLPKDSAFMVNPTG
jgi:hypothetical protein